MATERSAERTIIGAVIENGRIFKAGDEDALARVMQGKPMAHLIQKGVIAGDWEAPTASSSTTSTEDEEQDDSALPKVADLAEHLATLTTPEAVAELQARDIRKSAAKHYEARLAELAESEGGQ